jgi:hypothetical protein
MEERSQESFDDATLLIFRQVLECGMPAHRSVFAKEGPLPLSTAMAYNDGFKGAGTMANHQTESSWRKDFWRAPTDVPGSIFN